MPIIRMTIIFDNRLNEKNYYFDEIIIEFMKNCQTNTLKK